MTALDNRLAQRLVNPRYILLRFETDSITPCAGIADVVHFERRGVPDAIMLAPWMPRMGPSQRALADGRVHRCGGDFLIHRGSNPEPISVRLLATGDQATMPVVFFQVDGAFLGERNPYDVPIAQLRRDSLVFGFAVAEFLKRAPWREDTPSVIWGADWETVPALLLAAQAYPTALTLHNVFDVCLAAESPEFSPAYDRFRDPAETALTVGMQIADVLTAVNPGFARGLRTEPIYTRILADHLQEYVYRVVGIANANFREILDEQTDLLAALRRDLQAGYAMLTALQVEARNALPHEVRARSAGKVMVIAMGRRVSQKLHDVVVEAVRLLLVAEPQLPLFVVFATTPGDPSSAARLHRIQRLASDFPDHILWTDGYRADFDQLMRAADYNCMASLFEPHGGAFSGTIVPIARAIDGLAEQVRPFEPSEAALRVSSLWHSNDPTAIPSGLLFRERVDDLAPDDVAQQLRELLIASPTPSNELFRRMVEALAQVLRRAVDIRVKHPCVYARLVNGALLRQAERKWDDNFTQVMEMLEAAATRSTKLRL